MVVLVALHSSSFKPLLSRRYGQPVHTPNVDSLARGGLVFDNAYCQQAVCGPTDNVGVPSGSVYARGCRMVWKMAI